MENWVLCAGGGSWSTASGTGDVMYGDSHNIIKLKYIYMA